jgi:hypothetical protein
VHQPPVPPQGVAQALGVVPCQPRVAPAPPASLAVSYGAPIAALDPGLGRYAVVSCLALGALAALAAVGLRRLTTRIRSGAVT